MTKIECDVCHEEFDAQTVNINRSEISLNDEKLWLTHFECPCCNNLFRVCLDNSESLELIAMISKVNGVIESQIKAGKIPKDSIMKRKDVLKKRINAIQKILDRKYAGSFTVTN